MLTDKQVRALKTGKEREDVFDGSGGIPGFGVRVWGFSGKKTFFLMYRAPSPARPRDRMLRRLKLGRYGEHPPAVSLAEARRRAKAALGEVAKGVDPGPRVHCDLGDDRIVVTGRLLEFLPDGYIPGTFGHLAAEYLTRHAWVNKRAPGEDERMLRSRLLPRWVDVTLAQIDRREIRSFLDGVRESAPVAANRFHALLSKMFNLGIKNELASTNPTLEIEKSREEAKDRWLSIEELRALLSVLRDDSASRILKLVLLTGCRPGEVLGMRWENLETADWYRIPREEAKNGRETRVFLSEPARAVIAAQQATRNGSPFVFPGAREGEPLTTIKKPFHQLRKALAFNFTPHDLRRTCATHLARLGFPPVTIEEILNHKQAGVSETYNRYTYDREKSEALTAWAQELVLIGL